MSILIHLRVYHTVCVNLLLQYINERVCRKESQKRRGFSTGETSIVNLIEAFNDKILS
jgi:hypothetical protein